MRNLPNNCRCGKMSVFPKTWNTTRARLHLNWYIKYYFYDDNLNQKKPVVIKGMNKVQTLHEKQSVTKQLMNDEMDNLNAGFNPITNKLIKEDNVTLSKKTYFLHALQFAHEQVKLADTTKMINKSCLLYFTQAANKLRLERLSIEEVTVSQLNTLLDKVGDLKKKEYSALVKAGKQPHYEAWSASNYNLYRAHLGILYKYLYKKMKVVPANFVLDIDKEKGIDKIRETLTKEERKMINELLYHKTYSFWRFMQMFFHAGCRESEILGVKKSDVDIDNQRFKVLVKKGQGNYREEWRVIKNIAVGLWEEVLQQADRHQFLFSKGLVPGEKSINPKQISRRWKVHVKDPLGITADFYSLKHSNLDEVSALMGRKQAQKMAGHTSEATTLIYLVGEKERQEDDLKGADNSFA